MRYYINSSLWASVLLLSVTANPIHHLENLDQFSDELESRIYGGHVTPITEIPYQVSLQRGGLHRCGASIIATDVILTAGHCIHETDPRNYRVHAGSSYTDVDGSLHRVSKIFLHENFSIAATGRPANDIAVILLEDPIELDETRAIIQMFNFQDEIQEGDQGIVSGWGATEIYIASRDLMSVSIPMISRTDCNQAYEHLLDGILEGQICAAALGVGGKDSCQGDSGGPLAIRNKLAGIISYGNGCGEPEFPGVYTEVAFHRKWIVEKASL